MLTKVSEVRQIFLENCRVILLDTNIDKVVLNKGVFLTKEVLPLNAQASGYYFCSCGFKEPNEATLTLMSSYLPHQTAQPVLRLTQV